MEDDKLQDSSPFQGRQFLEQSLDKDWMHSPSKTQDSQQQDLCFLAFHQQGVPKFQFPE